MKNDYSFNPVNFDANDYTQAELQQLFTDILTGDCKPEFTSGGELTAEQARWESHLELRNNLQAYAIVVPEGYRVETIPTVRCSF